MKVLTLILCLGYGSSYCQQKEFAWLIGTWQEDGKQTFEAWKPEKDFLSAESFKIKEGNRMVTEEIKFIKKGNDFYYVPDVAGPQGPVEFKVISFDKRSFVAENPQHDFPKKITYEKLDETHLKASIGDANKTISYSFVKVK